MENQEQKQNSLKKWDKQKTLTIVGIVLCALLIPILVINCILIVKSWVNKDEVPNIGGRTPLIVLTDSMEPKIKAGDVIICHKIDPEDVREEYVIAFFDPASKNDAVLTHRVVDIEMKDGILYFQTKGDSNNSEDKLWVPETALIGLWKGFRIPIIGHIALFMQTTGGLLVCILVPLAIFLGYDAYRKKKADKTQKDDVEALKRELEALKAAKSEHDE
jgi:signal peptidase